MAANFRTPPFRSLASSPHHLSTSTRSCFLSTLRNGEVGRRHSAKAQVTRPRASRYHWMVSLYPIPRILDCAGANATQPHLQKATRQVRRGTYLPQHIKLARQEQTSLTRLGSTSMRSLFERPAPLRLRAWGDSAQPRRGRTIGRVRISAKPNEWRFKRRQP